MDPIVADLIGKVAPSVIAALVASWVAVRLALDRYKTESLWQRKLDSYTKILDGLHVCRLRSERLLNESLLGVKPTDAQKEEMKKRYDAASAELHRIVDTGLLLLPEAATKELEAVMTPRYADWQEMDFEEFWDSEHARLKKALSRLITIARADLRR